ncbi:TPA: hypothetical protein MYP48_003776 [Citrobacter freundii]|uniref:hypothetical protein n=1 Tax=Citrobacter freundii TaxID=546 RepID=UPI001BD0137A|nr:hypothetical protein [Citrobacter freundii]HCB1600675.1 hypothetical protein [Citrobacter freundii]HCB1726458.1 hypothetical protein [Citrobacter freundii]HCB1879054.1 hypothetical protein [Citrobacter freundii]
MSEQSSKEKSYQKSLSDEIDFKIVDQLHSAASQISGFCYEIKKLCVATLFIALTFIVKFTNNRLDSSIFISSYCMIFSFWFLDAVSYYYQVKLRGKILTTINSIKERNKEIKEIKEIKETDDGDMIIERSRVENKLSKKIFQAGINHSMWLYLLLTVFSVIANILYICGIIK